MTGWIALSDHPVPPDTHAPDVGLFVLELALPLDHAAVLIDHADGVAGARFSIFADPAAGLSVLARHGQTVTRLTLPGPLDPQQRGMARLVLGWSAEGGNWRLTLDIPGEAALREVCAASQIAPMPADLAAFALGQGAAIRHPAVLWFGITRGEVPPARRAWIGPMTPVDTPDGARAAGSLRAGDRVMTDAGPLLLRDVRRCDVPSRGSHTPVILRAPYFGAEGDLLVSADHLVRLSGPEVEYLFGDEAVLAEAAHLADARSAIFDQRRATAIGIVLETDTGAVLSAGGCGLGLTGGTPALRVLRAYEALPLLSLLGRGAQVRAA